MELQLEGNIRELSYAIRMGNDPLCFKTISEKFDLQGVFCRRKFQEQNRRKYVTNHER